MRRQRSQPCFHREWTLDEAAEEIASFEVSDFSDRPDVLLAEPDREVDYGEIEERIDALSGDWVVSGMADGLHIELKRTGRTIESLQPRQWAFEDLPVDEFPGLFRSSRKYGRIPAHRKATGTLPPNGFEGGP